MSRDGRARTYILGAGLAGRSIAAEMRRKRSPAAVAAFLDDDPAKIGSKIDGVPVLGPIADVVSLLNKVPQDEALIAIPEASRERLRQWYDLLKHAGFGRIRILPSLAQIIDGEAHLIQAREIDPLDLLGRTPIRIDLRESLTYLRGKRVLITGAGGSIGSELARQLLAGGAERLYLLGHGENSIYEIDRELRTLQDEGVGERATVVPVIGELQDPHYTRFILQRMRIDAVFHTAAYKHVPMLESNPVEAVKNNVFVTKHLVDAAKDARCERFVLVSTDKVVEPTSIYGATKQLAEEIVLNADGNRMRFLVVRFGNVLGSRGSIVPLFQKQISRGGPVTVTDPGTTRYFMTIPEAVSLVLKAGGVGQAGELYILDMGEPLAIRELAEQMIRFYGYEPGSEIPITYIGMRPGEKLAETLWGPRERPQPSGTERILRVERSNWSAEQLESVLRELRAICFPNPERFKQYRNRRELRRVLARHISSLPVSCDEPQY